MYFLYMWQDCGIATLATLATLAMPRSCHMQRKDMGRTLTALASRSSARVKCENCNHWHHCRCVWYPHVLKH